MANSRSSTISAAAADSALRRRLREPSVPTLDAPPVETNNESFDSDWNADDALRREMERLEASRQFSAGNALSAAGGDPFAVVAPSLSELDPLAAADGLAPRPAKGGSLPGPFAANGPAFSPAGPPAGDLERMRLENEELHKLVEEMKQIFAQASEQEAENVKTIDSLKSRLAEFEQAATGKDERIEVLTNQIHELEAHIQDHAAPPPPPNEDELSRMADELEKERCQLTRDRKTLDEEREQLRTDEEDMMRQMREMEVQMAKERAEMARQRTELQRLHGDVKRELELLQGSDRALTDRLVQFQRRHQDLQHRAGIAPTAPASAPAPAPDADRASERKDSGLLHRFFGRK